ncbi:helix-turn-helix transcriptional regulator [Deinococcus sp. QL22]|uniref:helix-turn-helix domain-containing protein n=1 Tax=Deinococcus sp. QL22 TaxID=2939437 RepID=UPI002016C3D6|nr:helix-turn-helix transcriptional regulator [Deinococcus sp. QL22]UQN10362.1 helix-turn-helix domain-containing protein [Deinococcus sp. QL22]UQN10496.1 helix-turn-helix domain-containing protein [Deinococcus sp. QL22]
MNEQVRKAVQEAMTERELSQGELARRTGLVRPAVSKLLNGTVGRVPENWQRILDELDLELVAQPRQKLPK